MTAQRESPTISSPGTADWRCRAVVRRSKSAIPLLLVVLVGAAPSITLIEIVPSSVIVHHNRPVTSFELEARLWTGTLTDRLSIIESDGYTLVWTSSQSWLKKTGGQGFRAVFTIDQANIQGTATVQVAAGNKISNPTTVTVVNGPAPGEDFLTATYRPGQAPDVALVSGVRNTLGGPCVLTFKAFVAGMGLGNVVDGCTGPGGAWKAAVLSTGHKAVVATGQWTPQHDPVNAGVLQGGSRVIPVALRVMLGDNALSAPELAQLRDKTMTLALAEFASANGVLASTRTGLKLAKPDTATIVNLTATEVNADGEVVVAGCRDGDERTSSRDVLGKLNVYYVNKLYNIRGRACPPHRWRTYPVIYVEVYQEMHATLVHEVGHTLGLTLPRHGHSEVVGGMDLSNVMTKGYYDWDRGGHRRLTVGQVFRMNTDSASWLNWAEDGNGAPVRESAAPRLACQCGGGDPAGSCPRVADDVSQPSAAADGTTDRDCWDRLFLSNAQATERPVAIIAGRRWRAPPDHCDPFLHGWDASLPGEAWVGLGNVTRHGDCRSRAVLFYPHFGVQVVDLSEPTFGLTQVSDDPTVYGSPSKPIAVDVRVYSAGAVVSSVLVGQHIDLAKTIFGPLNRTGISLGFSLSTAPCPQVRPHPNQIHVCYVSGMTSEGRLAGERRIKIGKAKGNTLSHFIGRALGLDTAPDLPGSIMQPSSENRGKKLTLGQVFRINVALRALPGCDSTEPCPPLDLDVGP